MGDLCGGIKWVSVRLEARRRLWQIRAQGMEQVADRKRGRLSKKRVCSDHKKGARRMTQETVIARALIATVFVFSLAGWSGPSGAEEASRNRYRAMFGELPADMATEKRPMTPERVALGRQLFYETRLSKGQTISCNSCHRLDNYGVDGEPTSPGHKGQRGGRNSPTVMNAGLHVAQFWDGRAADLEEQAKGPILNPIEMAMPSEERVVEVLESIPGYPPLFAAAFPDEANPVTYDNMALAIGAFERGLVTPSAFDLYIEEGLLEDENGEVALKCAGEVEAQIFGNSLSLNLDEVLAGVRTPARLLWARHGIFPREVFERVCAVLPGAQLVEADAGHLIPMEKPDWVVENVLDFCALA